jgi:hypothetical protein
MPALYGGRQPGQDQALWQQETELVDKNVFVNRKEKPDPRGDDLMECECRYQERPEEGEEGREGGVYCLDERCLNRSMLLECVRCGKGCGNQRLKKGMWAKTEVRPSGGKGWGLFLLEDVASGREGGREGGEGGREGGREVYRIIK